MSQLDKMEASDPGTSPQRLKEIAQLFPELRPVLFKNPSASQDLKDWLVEICPEIARAAAEAQVGHQKETESLAAATQPKDLRPIESPIPTGRPDTLPQRQGGHPFFKFIAALAVFCFIIYYFWNSVLPKFEEKVSENSESSTKNSQPNREEKDNISWLAPVGDGFSSYPLVDTPSKNISCELHEDYVGCSIAERYYS